MNGVVIFVIFMQANINSYEFLPFNFRLYHVQKSDRVFYVIDMGRRRREVKKLRVLRVYVLKPVRHVLQTC